MTALFRRFFPILLAITALAAPAAADIVNGTFEDGLTGWTVLHSDPGGLPNTGYRYPALADTTHGRPRGCCLFASECHITPMGSGISQTAQFGDVGSAIACRLEYDYVLIFDEGCYYSRGKGVIHTYLDGNLLSEDIAVTNTHWVHKVLAVTAGVHTLSFWGFGGYWIMFLDNITVVSDPSVAVEPATWSRIKALVAGQAD